MPEFISALQRMVSKAFPEVPTIAAEIIIERLKKGLTDEFAQNYAKTQMIRNSQITVDELEKKELCQMEEGTEQTEHSVLLGEDLIIDNKAINPTLSIGQIAELWAQPGMAALPTGQAN